MEGKHFRLIKRKKVTADCETLMRQKKKKKARIRMKYKKIYAF